MPHGGPHGAGFSAPRKAPTRAEIERTYDQALDRFIRQNQDKKQQQSSVKSVIADMPQKFQDFIARNTKDGRMNEAAKAIFRQYDDGRTQYSRDMNRMVQKSPEFAAARARRFPIETFIERMAPAAVGAMTGLHLGLGTLYDESRKLGSAAIGGLKAIAQKKGIIPKDNINPNTGTTSMQTDVLGPIQGPPAYDASGLAGYRDAIMREVPASDIFDMLPKNIFPETVTAPRIRQDLTPIGSTNPDDMNIAPAQATIFDLLLQKNIFPETITAPKPIRSSFTGETPTNRDFSGTQQQPFDPPMIPGGNPRGEVQSARLGALLGSDPNIAYGQEMNMLDVLAERARRGFNEGGLASINNPQYNMLMNASDFDI